MSRYVGASAMWWPGEDSPPVVWIVGTFPSLEEAQHGVIRATFEMKEGGRGVVWTRDEVAEAWTADHEITGATQRLRLYVQAVEVEE